MVTIAIAAVLAALAVPSFRGMLEASKLTSATNDLIATLARAKGDAVRRGKRVTLCISSDGVTCTTTGDWTQGWIMFNDDDHSATSATVENTTHITLVTVSTSNGIVFKAKGGQSYFSFGADGKAKLMNGGNGAGRIRVCNTSAALSNDTRAREIVINWAGAVNLEKPTGVAATCPAPT